MKMPRVLYKSAEVHAQIKRLFGSPNPSDVRVALVAYVGSDAESYLPHPKGLRVICAPSSGTDPDAIRRLINRGARVEVADKLHMKVYWSQRRGCIITSANASSNALGIGGLKEAGVLVPAEAVDIRRLIKYAQPRPITGKDLHKLDTLKKRQRKEALNRAANTERAADFIDWYASPHRSQWKLGWFNDSVSGVSVAAKEQTAVEYGRKQPHSWVTFAKGRVQANDWVLSFALTDRGPKEVQWLYVDFLVRVSPKERRYYFSGAPFHAVQVHSLSRYPLPPFRITRAFRRALWTALRHYGAERLTDAKRDTPPAQLLSLIAAELQTG